MLFTKQALNELASATARCAAVHPSGCTSPDAVASWAASRGRTRSHLSVTADMVAVTMSTTCNGVGEMAQATITLPLRKGAMDLLPQLRGIPLVTLSGLTGRNIDKLMAAIFEAKASTSARHSGVVTLATRRWSGASTT